MQYPYITFKWWQVVTGSFITQIMKLVLFIIGNGCVMSSELYHIFIIPNIYHNISTFLLDRTSVSISIPLFPFIL